MGSSPSARHVTTGRSTRVKTSRAKSTRLKVAAAATAATVTGVVVAVVTNDALVLAVRPHG